MIRIGYIQTDVAFTGESVIFAAMFCFLLLSVEIYTIRYIDNFIHHQAVEKEKRNLTRFIIILINRTLATKSFEDDIQTVTLNAL